MTISLALLTYGHPGWLRDCLESIDLAGRPKCPIRVFQDAPPSPEVDEGTRKACAEFGLPLQTLHTWGCIHGNAQFALMNSPEDWVLILADDNLVTPGCLTNMLRWIEKADKTSAGLLQVPIWHAIDAPYDFEACKKDKRRLRDVGPNPHWRGEEPLQYIAVHGSGFAVRRSLWAELGGFTPSTWCWDEDLSAKAWFWSRYRIFEVPGPGTLHGRPGEVGCRPQPYHDYGHALGWERGWRIGRDECGKLMREAMDCCGGDGLPLSQAGPREPFLSETAFPLFPDGTPVLKRLRRK
jgi:hypothetical protein